MDRFLKEEELAEHRQSEAICLAETMKDLKGWSLEDLPQYLTIEDGRIILEQSRRLVKHLEQLIREEVPHVNR